MTINISIPDVGSDLHPQITVLGVGGSGGNAVNNMMSSNLEGVDFLIANTDAQALQHSKCKKKIQLGVNSTRGLGAGMRPDIGKQAAEEAIEEINEKLSGSHMLFIAAGMGGGTGTGAAPVIAKIAREKGILTVGVVTKPFHFEGMQRMKLADKGLEDLQQHVDTLLIIPNQNLFRIANEKTTFADAFKMADDVLYAGVRGVTDLMVQPGLINLDFSDVKTVMSEMGKAMMGTGEASGEGRAIAAAEAAIANPLIDDVSLKGARGLIINITGGNDITLYEVDEAANRIKQEIDENANIIYGTTCDERLEGLVRVSLVATGIDVDSAGVFKQTSQTSSLLIDNSVYQKASINDNIPLHSSNEMQIKENFENNDIINQSNEIDNNTSIKSENLILNSENEQNTEQEKKNTRESIDEIHEDQEDVSKVEAVSYSENEEDSENFLEQPEEEQANNSLDESVTKTSVRKLSLFDTLGENSSENKEEKNSEDIKSEPVLETNIEEEVDHSESQENDQEIEYESGEIKNSDDEFNQENDDELLDIPTFLRRQAN